jgi:hypothetical protein
MAPRLRALLSIVALEPCESLQQGELEVGGLAIRRYGPIPSSNRRDSQLLICCGVSIVRARPIRLHVQWIIAKDVRTPHVRQEVLR